jgi:hypothetical protein
MAEPVHILFLLHDSTYLRNFDDCIRHLVRDGHRVTLAYPETRPGKKQKHREKLIFRRGEVDVLFAPRGRDDEWQVLAQHVRSARNHLLYRDSAFAKTTFVRERVTSSTPEAVRRIIDSPVANAVPVIAGLACRTVEDAIPAPASAKHFLSETRPDVVLVTPYVNKAAFYQVDYVKAAQELGIPVGVSIFSWDNLTSKGAIQVPPDVLFVWNDTQAEEARSLHRVSRRRIVVTGGMRFAKFFGALPRQSKEEFCTAVGLDPSKPLITYLGSSRTIAPDEHEFLWRWLQAVRASPDPRLRECNVFVRPHPTNPAIRTHWPEMTFSGVALWDAGGDDVSGVLQCVGCSEAVVGINTTAMLEAAALGKPVLTVLDDSLRGGQEERLHFHYLTSVGGGLVTVATTMEQHTGHLGAILNGDHRFADKSGRFSRAFLEPPPPYDSPVAAFADAVVRLARNDVRNRPRSSGGRRVIRTVARFIARRLSAAQSENAPKVTT